jgi:hypothetical protein
MLLHGRISMKGKPRPFKLALAFPPLTVVTCSVAERRPAAVGVKSTVTMQASPGFKVTGQLLLEITKSPAAAPVGSMVIVPVSMPLVS